MEASQRPNLLLITTDDLGPQLSCYGDPVARTPRIDELAMERLAKPPQWELYDLREDPVEFHNRAGEVKLRKVESRLKLSLANWQNETDDPFHDSNFLRQADFSVRP